MSRHYPQMDGLRAVAALAVVMIHVSAGLTGEYETALNQLSRFSVPMFMMLSGFGHGISAAGVDWRAALRRRMLRVLPPFVLWSALYLTVDAICGKPHAHPLTELLFGGAYMHLYYLFVLLQFLLLCPLLQRAVAVKPKTTLAISALASLGLQGAWCIQTVSGRGFPELFLPMARWFVPWLVFYVAGMYLRSRDAETIRLPLPVVIGLWAASAAAVLFCAARWPMLRSSSLRPDITLYVFASWLLLWRLFSRKQRVPKPLQMISRLSFGLYLAHPLVMRVWMEWTIRQQPVIYLTVWRFWLLALAGGLLLSWLLSLLPFGALLGGAGKEKRRDRRELTSSTKKTIKGE